MGTTESTLIDILCSRNDDELTAIKNEYRDEYGKSLENDIVGDTSGDFKELLLALLNTRRDRSYNVNYLKAREVRAFANFSRFAVRFTRGPQVFISYFDGTSTDVHVGLQPQWWWANVQKESPLTGDGLVC